MSLKYFDKNASEFVDKLALCSCYEDVLKYQRIYTPYFQDEIIQKMAQVNWDNLVNDKKDEKKIKFETKKTTTNL